MNIVSCVCIHHVFNVIRLYVGDQLAIHWRYIGDPLGIALGIPSAVTR